MRFCRRTANALAPIQFSLTGIILNLVCLQFPPICLAFPFTTSTLLHDAGLISRRAIVITSLPPNHRHVLHRTGPLERHVVFFASHPGHSRPGSSVQAPHFDSYISSLWPKQQAVCSLITSVKRDRIPIPIIIHRPCWMRAELRLSMIIMTHLSRVFPSS